MNNKLEHIFISMMVGAIRNSELENLHSGVSPSTKTGDYSDVKVVTPYGEIEWSKVSRISDKEMGLLKDSIREEITQQIEMLKNNGLIISVKEKSILSSAIKKFFQITCIIVGFY